MNHEVRLPGVSELADLVEQVVSTLEGSAVTAREPTEPAPRGLQWTGCVRLGGLFRGAVTIECPPPFARHVASTMLAVEAGALDDEVACEALGELTHIVGGNIKGLIGVAAGAGLCTLTAPLVAMGPLVIPAAAERVAVSFACGEHGFSVRLWESLGAADARAR
jgi:CheY-specific phosphatase CheX